MVTIFRTGVLNVVQRYDTSSNGNPRYTVTVGDTVFYTGVDSSYSYAVRNYEGKTVTVGLKMLRGKLTLVSLTQPKE